MRACASEEEEAAPDADLASAWLDDESASSLQQDLADPCVVGPTEAHELITSGKATLLDLRTQWQFARERVPGAANVPAGEPGPSGLLFHFRPGFEDELRTLHPPDAAPLLLICELGVVSLVAANRLLDRGWRDVSVVRGGLEAWRDEALPTEETAAAGGDFSGAAEAEEGEEAHLREEAGEAEWWRSAVGARIPEWTVAEGEEPGMWPVSGPDPLDELLDSDGGEGGQFGIGLDELELEDFSLFGEEEAPPPSPLDAAEAAAVGLDELVADLDRPLEEPKTAVPKAKKGAAKKRAAAAPVAAPPSEAYAALAGLEPAPPAAAAPRTSAAASYGGPSRQPRGGSKGGRFRGGLPPAWLVDVTNVDFAALASSGELAALSVKELKSYLYEREASLSGAKRVLVERVTDLLESQGSIEQDGASPAPADAPPAAAAAYPAAVNGASNGAAAPEEGADSDEVLSLFDTEAAGADEVLDDSLIDEVFSAM